MAINACCCGRNDDACLGCALLKFTVRFDEPFAAVLLDGDGYLVKGDGLTTGVTFSPTVSIVCGNFSRGTDTHWTAIAEDGFGGTLTLTESGDNPSVPGTDFTKWTVSGSYFNPAQAVVHVACCDDDPPAFDWETAPDTIYAYYVDPVTGALTLLSDQKMQTLQPDDPLLPIWDSSLHKVTRGGTTRYESGNVRVRQIDDTYAKIFVRGPDISSLQFLDDADDITGIQFCEYTNADCSGSSALHTWVFNDYSGAGSGWRMPQVILLAEAP
ncbi:MAG TPA: hypothetical protein VHM90_06785 [Phycisphaerae bacterium]|nr:hypothetical protein [Phycisphaerae bacterium]